MQNVEFVKGYIEDLPLPDASVDVVISNCVINLSGDKQQVLREAARVLRPGGRFAVSDVIADPEMDDATRADMAQWTGCIAGALTEAEFAGALAGRRPRGHRDPRDPSRARARRLGDHPRTQARMSDGDIQLNDPQTLYRRWEDSQWNPFEIDLGADIAQWARADDGQRGLLHFVLSSLMVAEERITTKFSGLVGAHGSEEEATFLATQQVDEARHMQFYARFQDEVVADPATIAAHVERARAQRLRCVPADLRRRARRGARAARRRSRRPRRQGPLRHDLPPDPRGHARPDDVQVLHGLPERARGCCPGFVEGYSKIHHDETRHIGYGVWYLRETVREHPETAEVVRATLRELLPVGGGVAAAAGRRGRRRSA